ncbi:MAG: ribonuclease H-like domain-containing protein [Pseudomonadota bacterium]
MLTRTFQHLPGIGARTESYLWEAGLGDWQDLEFPDRLNLPARRIHTLASQIDESRRRMDDGNFKYFEDRLPAGLHWRFFPEIRDRAVYLDIETTGLDRDYETITTIALYDGKTIQTFVQGRDLEMFPDVIREYGTIITYNGKCFDVPFLERYFGMSMAQVHIDLRYILKSLGFGGGLKGCERSLGIDRGELAGVDGFDAVLLWHEFMKTGRSAALETLLAYNVDDVVNLELLMVQAFNRKVAQTPFAGTLGLGFPCQPQNPFCADAALVRRLRRAMPMRF